MLHSAIVNRVIDGDTYCCTVSLDFDITLKIIVRLFGVDAWEMHGEEKQKGTAAKCYIEGLIAGNTVTLNPYKRDSFGRWLCDVYFKGQFVADLLEAKGFLKPVHQESKRASPLAENSLGSHDAAVQTEFFEIQS